MAPTTRSLSPTKRSLDVGAPSSPSKSLKRSTAPSKRPSIPQSGVAPSSGVKTRVSRIPGTPSRIAAPSARSKENESRPVPSLSQSPIKRTAPASNPSKLSVPSAPLATSRSTVPEWQKTSDAAFIEDKNEDGFSGGVFKGVPRDAVPDRVVVNYEVFMMMFGILTYMTKGSCEYCGGLTTDDPYQNFGHLTCRMWEVKFKRHGSAPQSALDAKPSDLLDFDAGIFAPISDTGRGGVAAKGLEVSTSGFPGQLMQEANDASSLMTTQPPTFALDDMSSSLDTSQFAANRFGGLPVSPVSQYSIPAQQGFGQTVRSVASPTALPSLKEYADTDQRSSYAHMAARVKELSLSAQRGARPSASLNNDPSTDTSLLSPASSRGLDLHRGLASLSRDDSFGLSNLKLDQSASSFGLVLTRADEYSNLLQTPAPQSLADNSLSFDMRLAGGTNSSSYLPVSPVRQMAGGSSRASRPGPVSTRSVAIDSSISSSGVDALFRGGLAPLQPLATGRVHRDATPSHPPASR